MGARLAIIFAFLLSVAAAGGSYYLYQNLNLEKGRFNDLSVRYDQTKEKLALVQTERDRFKAESEENKARIDELQAQIEQVRAEISRTTAESAAFKKQVQISQLKIQEMQKKVDELTKRNQELDAKLKATEVPQKTTTLSQVQSIGTTALTFTPAQETKTAVSGAPKTVSPVATAVETQKTATSLSSSSTVTKSPQPIVPASTTAATASAVKPVSSSVVETANKAPRILTVNRKFNFVVINMGLQDGLKVGDKVNVLKNGKPGAVLQVEKLYDKFSAATILEENPQAQIQEGDGILKA